LAIATERSKEDLLSESKPAYHTSNVLRLFMENLGKRRDAQLLDVGPICGDNINFFAQRVKKLFVCDMFLQFDRARHKGTPPREAWQRLDYPPESFDGILLWELMGRLDDREVELGAELCYRMTKPGGMLVLFVPDDHAVSRGMYTFVVEEGFQLRIQNHPKIELTYHRRQSRDMLTMLTPFTQLRSFIYRNGYKEFLFQRR
jgi:SAM-dependent methyltransferase